MHWTEEQLRKALANNPALKAREAKPKAASRSGKSAALQRPTFDSAAEERYFEQSIRPVLLAGLLLQYELHKTFEIVPAMEHCGKKYKNRVYTPDFYLEYRDGTVEVVEIKGRAIKKLQRDYPLRRQLFIYQYCIPNGWRFLEIHDDET